LVGLFGSYLAAQFLLTDDWNLLGVFVIGIIGAGVAVRILNNRRHGLYILYFCQDICGEGVRYIQRVASGQRTFVQAKPAYQWNSGDA
jgi:hypothetical protein